MNQFISNWAQLRWTDKNQCLPLVRAILPYSLVFSLFLLNSTLLNYQTKTFFHHINMTNFWHLATQIWPIVAKVHSPSLLQFSRFSLTRWEACWCTKQWQNSSQVLHNDRIKFQMNFFAIVLNTNVATVTSCENQELVYNYAYFMTLIPQAFYLSG